MTQALAHCGTAMRRDSQVEADSQGQTRCYRCPLCGREIWFRAGEVLDRTGPLPEPPRYGSPIRHATGKQVSYSPTERAQRERDIHELSKGQENNLGWRYRNGLCGCGCGAKVKGHKHRWIRGHQGKWIVEMRAKELTRK